MTTNFMQQGSFAVCVWMVKHRTKSFTCYQFVYVGAHAPFFFWNNYLEETVEQMNRGESLIILPRRTMNPKIQLERFTNAITGNLKPSPSRFW